jgi:hypothetical protein
MATKHGLGTWLDGIISDNMRGECVTTSVYHVPMFPKFLVSLIGKQMMTAILIG